MLTSNDGYQIRGSTFATLEMPAASNAPVGWHARQHVRILKTHVPIPSLARPARRVGPDHRAHLAKLRSRPRTVRHGRVTTLAGPSTPIAANPYKGKQNLRNDGRMDSRFSIPEAVA